MNVLHEVPLYRRFLFSHRHTQTHTDREAGKVRGWEARKLKAESSRLKGKNSPQSTQRTRREE
jgi:hypothetical protein